MLFKKLSLSGVFAGLALFSQAQLSDNFNDGDFTTGTTWTGNTAVYTVNAGLRMQLNNTVAATTYMSTPYSAASIDNFEWNILVQQAFAGSASNFGRVYLVSDQADVTGSLNGYYLQFGEAGSTDAIELFRQTGLTSTSVCRGPNGSIAASFTVRIRVLRDAAGFWEVFADHAGGTAYVLEASGTDMTHTTSAHFGMRATYTVSNADKFYYDDIYMGPEIVDNVPPQPVSATPLSANTLDVMFNEGLDPVSSQVTTNYNVNGGIGNPSAAVLDGTDNKLVHLSFTPAFTNLTNYELVVDNVADVPLNVINNDTIGFFYFEPDTAAFRDVVINEFMADESPQVGLPAAEFVELYNRSTKIFDLAGWTLSDGSSTAVLGTKVLLPGAYLIVCANADTADFSPYGNTLGVSSLPSLNNSGDAITIKNNLGTTIDHLDYTLAWYNDGVKDDGGWTLEQINPDAACINATNWSASNATAGGTPGTVNSIYNNTPDTQAPEITSVIVNTGTQVTLTFSEPVDTSATAGFVFTVSGGITVASFNVVLPGLNQIIVNFTTAVDTGIVYTITATNVPDCSGNGLGTSDNAIFVLPFPPAYREVVINEFLADESPQVGLPAAEFIELYNRSSLSFNVNGWTISDGGTPVALGPKILGPGQYLILCAHPDTSDYKLFGPTLGVTSFPSLNNTGDAIVLRNADGDLVDAINFTDDWYRDGAKDDGGWSIEQINPDASCINASNWRASVDSDGGTPGTVNSVFNNTPDVQAPTIVNYTLNSALQITLTFSEPLDTSSISSFVFAVSGGIGVSSFNMLSPELTRVVVNFSSPVDSGVVYTLTATGVLDCEGNGTALSSTVDFIVAFQALNNEIIINEVLFDPATGVDDFVELYNNSSRLINLKDWYFANFDDDTIANHKAISTTDLLIKPGEYFAFTTDKSALETYYVQSAKDRIIEISSMPSYNNDSGSVILISNLNRLSDVFSYDESMHFALLETVDGVSLERLDFNRTTQDAGNWHSASQEVGFSTPGYQNSQYNPDAANGDGFTLGTEIFSPDNDGYQDVINFHYVFAEAGYVGNATIYDARARETKKLLRNELLGTSGTFTWDGVTDKNEKAAIGVYIIYFEYFNLSGQSKKVKKSFVVAGKF